MATDVIFVLEQLSCIREGDGSGHSEPYIWPVLIWIDDDTLNTPQLVGVTSPALGNARVVIKDDMRAGEVADIPGQVGILRVRLDDNQAVRQLILAVALWENDETPEKAMREGYNAFSSELGLAIGDANTLAALNVANTPQQRQPIIDAIELRVSGRVESAIKNSLTGSQKIRVKLGTLNLDDIVNSDVRAFPQGDELLLPQTFSLEFVSPPSNHYVIAGQLMLVPVVVDPCEFAVARVRAAQGVVNSIESEIRSLQAQMRGAREPGEPRLPKAFIIAEIRRIREEDLAPAEAELDAARSALSVCRRRVATAEVPQGGGVLSKV